MRQVVFLIACLVAGHAVAADALERVQLPYGLSISIPSGWYVHDSVSADSIADRGSRMMPQLFNREGDQKERLLISQNRQLNPTMIVRVSRSPVDSKEVNQDGATNLDNNDLQGIAEEYRQVLDKPPIKASSVNAAIVRFRDLWMLHISYERSSLNKEREKWQVSMFLLPFNGSQTILTISHRKGDQHLISLAKRIRDSFDLKGSRKKYMADDPAFMRQLNQTVRSWKYPYRMDSVTVRTGARVVENKRLVFYHEVDDQFADKIASADRYKVKMNIRNGSCSDKQFEELAGYFRDGITQSYSTRSGKEVIRVNATCR